MVADWLAPTRRSYLNVLACECVVDRQQLSSCPRESDSPVATRYKAAIHGYAAFVLAFHGWTFSP